MIILTLFWENYIIYEYNNRLFMVSKKYKLSIIDK